MAMNFGSFASRVVATKVVATDGTGDFTDIQAAIDDLPTTGGVVYVKEGTYTITSTIIREIDDVTIIGAGKSSKITTTINDAMLRVRNDNWIIQNLFFSGAGAVNLNNSGILGAAPNGLLVDHCFFNDCGAHGISLVGVGSKCIISNNICDSNVNNGIIMASISQSVVVGNICKDNSGWGIRLTSNSDQNTVTANICTGNTGSGIQLLTTPDKNIILGNICLDNGSPQIDYTGTNTEIAHNITV